MDEKEDKKTVSSGSRTLRRYERSTVQQERFLKAYSAGQEWVRLFTPSLVLSIDVEDLDMIVTCANKGERANYMLQGNMTRPPSRMIDYVLETEII